MLVFVTKDKPRTKTISRERAKTIVSRVRRFCMNYLPFGRKDCDPYYFMGRKKCQETLSSRPRGAWERGKGLTNLFLAVIYVE